MTLRTEYVHHGMSGWTDYSRSWGKRQWLVDERAANFWTSFLAVYLTLATARAFPFVRRLCIFFWPRAIPQDTGDSEHRPSEVKRQLKLAHSAEGAVVRLFWAGLSQMKPRAIALPEDGLPRQPPRGYWGDAKGHLAQNRGEISRAFSLAFLMLSMYASFTFLSIFSAAIFSDSVALSNSPNCGLLVKNFTGQSLEDDTRWRKYLHDTEVEIGQYAKLCYSNEAGPESCNSFYNRSIRYEIRHNESCPFSDDLCRGGPLSAFTADTGLIDAEIIGINSPLRYKFRRVTTCSPLRMDLGSFLRPDNETQSWRYYYGRNEISVSKCPDGLADCTWSIPLLPAEPNKPSYQAYTLTYNPDVEQRGQLQRWQPISGLRPAKGTTVTLIGIQNSLVMYNEPRDDPIFTARRLLSADDKYTWYNDLFSAGIIACNDQAYICEPKNDTCRNFFDIEDSELRQGDNETQTVMTMLLNAVARHSLYDVFALRLQNALDAQSKLVDRRSLPLAPEQWKVEVQLLFEASLAKIQTTARDMTRGLPDNLPGSQNILEILPMFRQICNSYKFRSTGWKNINVKPFSICIILGFFVFLLGIEQGDELMLEKWLKYLRTLDLRHALSSEVLGGLLSVMYRSVKQAIMLLFESLVTNIWNSMKDRVKKDAKSVWNFVRESAKTRFGEARAGFWRWLRARDNETGTRRTRRGSNQEEATWWPFDLPMTALQRRREVSRTR